MKYIGNPIKTKVALDDVAGAMGWGTRKCNAVNWVLRTFFSPCAPSHMLCMYCKSKKRKDTRDMIFQRKYVMIENDMKSKIIIM